MARREVEPYNHSIEGLLLFAPFGTSNWVTVTDVAIINMSVRYKIDEQKPVGKNKGKCDYQGQNLTRARIEYIILPSEFDNFWLKVHPLLVSRDDKVNPKLYVSNITFSRYGLTKAIVENFEIGWPDPVNGRKVSITLVEFREQGKTPKESKDKANPNPGSNIVRDQNIQDGAFGSVNGSDGRPLP